MTRLARAVVAALLLSVAACPRPLDPNDYERSCDVDSDCVSLDFGDVCDSCASNHQAINVGELDAFQRDFNAAVLQCGPRLPETRDCVAVPLNIPNCVDGACVHDDIGEQCVVSPCVGVDDDEENGENP